MDGDGRWAKQRGLPRTEGHKVGESSLLDVIMGAIELGIPYLSAYAFSTENWRRSQDEVRFLMGFNRDVIHRRRDLLNEMGVRIRWAGRRRRLWRSVISELEEAERMSAGNSVLTLQFCVNYGGRAEIADAAAAIAADVAAGKVRPDKVDEKLFARYLDEPEMPDVDLFVRSSGEHRTSNFLIWQAHYAELVFLDTLWPDFDRRHLWQACEIYASRDRRYGGAIPNSVSPGGRPPGTPRDALRCAGPGRRSPGTPRDALRWCSPWHRALTRAQGPGARPVGAALRRSVGRASRGRRTHELPDSRRRRATSSSATDLSSLVNRGAGVASGVPGAIGRDAQRAAPSYWPVITG
jgi:trans,polycis-polyprenyl diphosphate synthase